MSSLDKYTEQYYFVSSFFIFYLVLVLVLCEMPLVVIFSQPHPVFLFYLTKSLSILLLS